MKMKMEQTKGITWIGVCVIVWIGGSCVTAAEVPAGGNVTDEKIQTLVKELGSEEFDKRQAAENELVKVGIRAEKALQAAQSSLDPQVQATAKRLVTRLKFANMGPVDYLQIIPAQSMVALHINNLAMSTQSAKASAVGKLIFSPAMQPFRARIEEELKKNPEKKDQLLTWLNRFQGQFVAGVWSLNFMVQNENNMGAMAEITDPDPVMVYKDFLAQTGIAQMSQSSFYKDVDILEGPGGQGAIALLGKHLLIASNPVALKQMVDGFLAPNGLRLAPSFTSIKAALGPSPELLFILDYQAYLKAIAPMLQMVPGMQDMLSATGAEGLRQFFVASACKGDAFEERYVMTVDKTTQLGQNLLSMQPDAGAAPPENALAVVPANAIAAEVYWMDGPKTQAIVVQQLESVSKAMTMMSQMNPAGNTPDIGKIISEFEAKAGIKIGDFISNFKGEVGYWVALNQAPGLSLPDLGMFLTCADAQKAKGTSDALTRMLGAINGIPAVKEVTYRNRMIYQVDLAALVPALPPMMTYTPCWTVDGSRIYLSSSTQALQKQINNIDNKGPGLLTEPDFVKALGLFSAEERKGGIGYVNMKKLLSYGATVGFPLLQTQISDVEIGKAIAALPKSEELFKDIPSLVGVSIVRDDRAEIILRGPLPPMLTLIGGAFVLPTIFYGYPREHRQVVPPPDPPGGF